MSPITMFLFLCSSLLILESSYGAYRSLAQNQINSIDELVKEEVILAIPQRTNDTNKEFDELLAQCETKIDLISEECKACAKASCDEASANEIAEQKKKKLHEAVLPLLYEPLKRTVKNLKLVEKSISKVLKVIGLKDAEKFLKKIGGVVKDVSGDLLKNAKHVVKKAGKLLEKFGKNLANLAKDIGKGFEKSVKKLGEEAKRLGKKIGKTLKDVGKSIGKAAKKVIKEIPKALKKLTSKVGDVAKKVGKTVEKITKKVTKPVGRFFRKVFGGWGKRSTRYRRLAQCASVCPSCRQIDSEDPDVLISNVCGADHLNRQNALLENVDKIQRALNASLDENTNIVREIEYDVNSNLPSGFSFSEVLVTIATSKGNHQYKSPVPLDAFDSTGMASSIAIKVFEYI